MAVISMGSLKTPKITLARYIKGDKALSSTNRSLVEEEEPKKEKEKVRNVGGSGRQRELITSSYYF